VLAPIPGGVFLSLPNVSCGPKIASWPRQLRVSFRESRRSNLISQRQKSTHKTVFYLRAKSDRSNLPRCSTSPGLGIHSESHGSESCSPMARQGTPARAPVFFSISAIGPKAGRRRLACSTDIQSSLFDSGNYAWRRGKDAVWRAASWGGMSGKKWVDIGHWSGISG